MEREKRIQREREKRIQREREKRIQREREKRIQRERKQREKEKKRLYGRNVLISLGNGSHRKLIQHQQHPESSICES
jgi:hypothetical protein